MGRGIPSIAFSAFDFSKRVYTSVNGTTAAGFKDPSTILGELGVKLVKQLEDKAKGGALLPKGYGISM